jgi:hypothetical protein
MKKTAARRKTCPPFADGQVWQLEGSRIQIAMVGKTLVHYKHFQGELKRAPVSIANKRSLEQFLIAEKAVLTKG